MLTHITVKLMPIHKKSIVNRLSAIVPKKGFTLIELLVVIAIIGILATFIVASFASAQARGRDARRKADLDAVKKALELAKNDCTGARWYPVAQGASGQARYTTDVSSLDSFLDNNTLNYIRALPHDPTKTLGGPDDYHYAADPGVPPVAPGNNVCLRNATTRDLPGLPRYSLSAVLENANDPAGAASLARCSGFVGVPRSPLPAQGVVYYVCSD